MNEHIKKNMVQITEGLTLTENQIEIIKLVLEKTYIQGMQEGSNKTYDMFNKNSKYI